MSDITGCKNKCSIIHISGLLRQIYSAWFEITKDYGKSQDFAQPHTEDGCVNGRGWMPTEHV